MSAVLAVLQNQWFKNPDRVRAMIARQPADQREKMRRRLIASALFMGCRSGLNLRRVFGGEWCERIVWEEASREIGGQASAVFPADPAHLSAVLAELNPRIVLAFGRIAGDALAPLCNGRILILAPHPAARGGDTLRKLGVARRQLESHF
jgi:hypothetical protein